VANVCNVEFFYKEKHFKFPQPELSNFFTEDEEYYKSEGRVFHCFRATFLVGLGNASSVIFNESVDSQLIHQISELTIKRHQLSEAAEKIIHLYKLFIAFREHNYPVNLIFTLKTKNETICTSNNHLITKISIAPLKDCATFDLLSITRINRAGGSQALSATNILMLNGDTGISCKVDRISLTQLANIKMHFGSFREWTETLKKITLDTQVRISKSTGAEKVSTASPTPAKLPQKTTVE